MVPISGTSAIVASLLALAFKHLFGLGEAMADGFVKEECVHGALVGGASLKADQFLEIVSITAVAKERQSVRPDGADQ